MSNRTESGRSRLRFQCGSMEMATWESTRAGSETMRRSSRPFVRMPRRSPVASSTRWAMRVWLKTVGKAAAGRGIEVGIEVHAPHAEACRALLGKEESAAVFVAFAGLTDSAASMRA